MRRRSPLILDWDADGIDGAQARGDGTVLRFAAAIDAPAVGDAERLAALVRRHGLAGSPAIVLVPRSRLLFHWLSAGAPDGATAAHFFPAPDGALLGAIFSGGASAVAIGIDRRWADARRNAVEGAGLLFGGLAPRFAAVRATEPAGTGRLWIRVGVSEAEALLTGRTGPLMNVSLSPIPGNADVSDEAASNAWAVPAVVDLRAAMVGAGARGPVEAPTEAVFFGRRGAAAAALERRLAADGWSIRWDDPLAAFARERPERKEMFFVVPPPSAPRVLAMSASARESICAVGSAAFLLIGAAAGHVADRANQDLRRLERDVHDFAPAAPPGRPLAALLGFVFGAVPSDVRLTGVTADNRSRTLRLMGRAADYADVSALSAALERGRRFATVRLGKAAVTRMGARSFVDFSLEASW